MTLSNTSGAEVSPFRNRLIVSVLPIVYPTKVARSSNLVTYLSTRGKQNVLSLIPARCCLA